jgi:hypothetical protein
VTCPSAEPAASVKASWVLGFSILSIPLWQSIRCFGIAWPEALFRAEQLFALLKPYEIINAYSPPMDVQQYLAYLQMALNQCSAMAEELTAPALCSCRP